MENTLNEKIMGIEKKAYTTPELLEHGVLQEVTKSGGRQYHIDMEDGTGSSEVE